MLLKGLRCILLSMRDKAARVSIIQSKVTHECFEQRTSLPCIYLQVSFRGNIPQAEEGKLSATIVGKKNLRY